MTIDEAIRILSADESDRHPDTNPEINDATALGVEALKAIRDVRPTDYGAIDDPLPGETKE